METLKQLIEPLKPTIDSIEHIFNSIINYINNSKFIIYIFQACFIIWCLYYLISFLWSVFKNLYCHIVYKLFMNKNFQKKYGEWAVVTGATDGIGKYYTHELAARKMNIVLISRNESKLRKCADEIETKFKVKTKYIKIDFSNSNDDIYHKIEEQLSGYDIGALVNNVGVARSGPTTLRYKQMSVTEISDEITINCKALTQMIRMILPKLIHKKKGLIINMGSTSGIVPLAYEAIYSGTKGYVQNFTMALQADCIGTGVTIQLLEPGVIKTNMSKELNFLPTEKNLLCPGPETFARHAAITIGILNKCGGFWFFDILNWVTEHSKKSLAVYVTKLFVELNYDTEFLQRNDRKTNQ